MTETPNQPTPDKSSTPAFAELADENDQLGWDREKHGTFAAQGTPDDAVKTVPADEYLDSPDGEDA
jgi:hypothetical protein